MSEFIVIQVGQCGNQIGNAFWSSVVQEYGITSNMKLPPQKPVNSFFHIENPENSLKAKLKARAILIDMEDSVLARFRNGPLKRIIDSKSIISNYPGSGNNWAEGFCYHGPQYKQKILNVVRKTVEKCDALLGFLLMFSTSGGTGSGVGSFILQLLADYYPDIDRFATCIYPLGTEDVITCPYNMALATEQLSENATCVFPVENRALSDIVNTQLNDTRSKETTKYVSGCQPYEDMNNIIANMLLHLTSCSRYSGELNLNMSDIATNMIPYSAMNFLSSGYSPLTVTSRKIADCRSSERIKDELFVNCTQRGNHLVKFQGLTGTTLALTLLGRGDFTTTDAQKYTVKLQQKFKFTPWSSKAIRTSLCSVPPFGHDRGMLCLQNTTAMSSLFTSVSQSFHKIYRRKAHLHHYLKVDGFEESYFKECRESLLKVLDGYKEIEELKPVIVPRIKPKQAIL